MVVELTIKKKTQPGTGRTVIRPARAFVHFHSLHPHASQTVITA